MLILAFDPGQTTGYCLLRPPLSLVEAGEVRGHLGDILRLLEHYRPDEVVLEEFRLYPWAAKSQSWDSLFPSQVIGAVKAWCLSHQTPCVEQPTAKRTFYSNQLLREAGVYVPKSPHANDAVRHALARAWEVHGGFQTEEVQDVLRRLVRERREA